MTRSRDGLFLLAAALETLAILAAIQGEVPLAAGLHLSSAIAVAGGPGRVLVRDRNGWLLAFVFALFLPAAGAPGVWIAARFGSVDALEPGPHLVRTKIPAAEEVIAVEVPRTQVRIPTHLDSAAVLRRALRHSDEDLRLVAHAILESKSREAYRAVHNVGTALCSAAASDRGSLHFQLAARQFELVRLGLAEGDSLNAALQEARTHARVAVNQIPQDRSAHALLGRIELQLGHFAAAELAFIRAMQLGLPDAIARPYLAESAFLSGRLDAVRQHLVQVPPHSNAVVKRMRRYWV